MRDYGVVRVRFWAWAKETGLSVDAQRLAIYCLTSPHTVGTGCFRLPVSYIAEDLGTVPDTVRHTLSELSEVGFLEHDESTGWLWIVGFLDHNPIVNSNVGKSLVSFIESVPTRVPFYAAFLDALDVADTISTDGKRRLPNGLIDRLRKGIGNGMANGSGKGMPTHEHEHEHDQDHDHQHEAPTDGAGEQPDDDDATNEPEPERVAFDAWNGAARRVGRWPMAKKLDDQRRRGLRGRIKDAGGLEDFLAVLAKAEASRFVRKEMTGFGLDWFLTRGNFAKVAEGNYDDDRRGAPAATMAPSKAAALIDMADQLRQREQAHGG